MSEKGKLYLLPSPLGEGAEHVIPPYVVERLHQLDVFIAERAKTARHFIKRTHTPRPLSELRFFELNKHTPPEEIRDFLAPAEAGADIGLLSEAGCPGVADPGAQIVRLAHERGIEVVPLVGPSSLLLALMASGMNGQQFCFHGYLPPQRSELARELRRLEQQSQRLKQTQLFIETPYRNGQLLETALSSLAPSTRLCIAVDLTLPSQFISTQSVGDWKKQPLPDLNKRPAVFLLEA